MKLLLAGVWLVLFFNSSWAAEVPFYVGTFTDHSTAQGIYRGSIESETGKLGPFTLVAKATNPNFLALSPDHKFLYAVTTTATNSAVAAFAMQPDGALKLLNEQPVDAMGACHVSVDKTGRDVSSRITGAAPSPAFKPGWMVRWANVRPGSNSRVRGPTGGGRTNRMRIRFTPIRRINSFIACDLGSDRVWIFKFDAVSGTLLPNDPLSAMVPPGSGPRHLAIPPNGKFVYVANEMGCSVTLFSRDADSGRLTAIETVSTLLKDAPTRGVTVAEVACHPTGRWLYVSNRGCDTLSVFKIAADGRLSLIQSTAARVQVPRSFALDPTGRWLIAAGQKDNRLAVFSIDPETGRLAPTDQSAEVGAPVCVVF